MATPPRGPQGREERRNNDRPARQSGPGQAQPSPEMIGLCKRIALDQGADGNGRIDPDLFDGIAREAAEDIGDEGKNLNKTSQLRKFYNELLMWEDRVNGKGPNGAEDRLHEYLPLIRMLNAKAAYAQGRGHVGPDFVCLLRSCLEQVKDDPESLRHARLFFEAFMGFYKVVRP